MMKKNYKKVMAGLFGIAAAFIMAGGLQSKDASAKRKIQNLQENKVYQIDLDQDGKKEKVQYTLKVVSKIADSYDELFEYQIKINGKVAFRQKNLYDAYFPQLQLTDIDKKDGVLDLWGYCMGESDDVILSSLFEYRSGKLKRVFDLKYKQVDDKFVLLQGELSRVGKNGVFYVTMDRAFGIDYVTGNHYDEIPYRLKNGKVTRVKTHTYRIVSIISAEKDHQKLIAKKDTKFYSSVKNQKKVAFVLKKGQKVRAVKLYYDGKKLLVQFKTQRGKLGWLDTKGYSFEKRPFSNEIFCD